MLHDIPFPVVLAVIVAIAAIVYAYRGCGETDDPESDEALREPLWQQPEGVGAELTVREEPKKKTPETVQATFGPEDFAEMEDSSDWLQRRRFDN
jgi:hypothetical protein